MGIDDFGCASSGQFFPALKSERADWAIKSVESRDKVGPDFRENAIGKDFNEWTAQTGLEATTYNGHRIGLEYRRRDYQGGSGRNDGEDNGVWLTWSIPVWNDTSRPNKEKLLEQRIANLENKLRSVQSN